MIGNAVAMGLSAKEVLSMTIYDYSAAIHHFNLQQGGEPEAAPLGESDFDDMLLGMAMEGMH